jgi:ATP-dependent helicase/nuclease subunit B
MPEAAGRPRQPAVFTIPSHRSFADSLVAGLIARHGRDPLSLASGRILLPNNRAVRSVTDAFVRASGGGLVLPRLIPVGDPELDERIGAALDPAGVDDPVPPAVEPLERLLALAGIVRGDGETASEALRMAADLARTLDALLVEEVEPSKLADSALVATELAVHWQLSLDRLRAILEAWPARLRQMGRIDSAERRNLLLHRLARRWRTAPPPGFTVAAGITSAAPAIAALLKSAAFMAEGSVVLPGLARTTGMADGEWEALGPNDQGKSEETHPQFHLKLLLDRLGVAREEVRLWPRVGRAASPSIRGRAVANAMTSADFSDKWNRLKPAERRLSGIRAVELPDSAAEAQAVALAIREALETPGRTAALVTPNRTLARRVSALLARWDIAADDSAGRPLSELAPGTLLLGIAAALAEELAPVPLLALLKHPLVGGENEARRQWLDHVRLLDLALRGPRPPAGLSGLDRHFDDKEAEGRHRGCQAAWRDVRAKLEALEQPGSGPLTLAGFAQALVGGVEALSGGAGWCGPDGRMTAQLLSELQASSDAQRIVITGEDGVAILRQLLEGQRIRPAYGGHPRVFIWGLLEARLQQADLVILGGLNEGVWPAAPAPDPWLAPKIRANLGLPGLEFRIGLSAHDFASALGAADVLITRARRDGRSPTVASRLWLRLNAMTGGLARDLRLERLALALDDPGPPKPVDRPQPCPPARQRPKKISVTAVDRLKADPFAFYAQAMLGLRDLDPVDADHSARWKGSAVHDVLDQWLKDDDCDPASLRPRALELLSGEGIHPMLRALWQPRLMEAIDWIAALERDNQAEGRRPLKAEITGKAVVAGVTVQGRADRIDLLADGGVAIVDYKTGAPPTRKAVDAGFALQLGLLGLIARAGGFDGVSGEPRSHEYWSLVRNKDGFGKLRCADDKMGAAEFLAHAESKFGDAARKWLTGSEPFTAKLNPAYAPYGDYDQLMRLEEWYGRSE